MHDLRKQVLLESKKTTSRRAASKAHTPAGSKPTSPSQSRGGSAAPSRNVSDDESEASEWGNSSIDELLSEGADDTPQDALTADLYQRIEQILDKKRSSVEGRELTLNAFTTDLIRHFSKTEIQSKMSDLLPAILKSVKAGQSEREIALGLKAIALMIITVPSDTIYDAVANPIKSAISDSPHPTVKVSSIHALGIATFYGGASTEETEDIMDFLLEIISSDGASVEEPDNADLVTAALEEWGFLATQLDDMEDATEPAMETFVDQLESSSSRVQIAAGENIALLFEKSYTEAESDDDSADEQEIEETRRAAGDGTRMIKRYTVYRQQHNLIRSLEELTRASSKRVSKKDRKAIHAAFQDVLNTVEKPTRGPRYSTALDEDGREYGSRLRVSVGHAGGRMLIDRWWKLARLNGLKRLLQGGFLTHYERNEVVFESLPVIVEDDDGEFE
jgi:translation elongation factor EF-1beta